MADVAAGLEDLGELKVAVVIAKANGALEPCRGARQLASIPHHDGDVVRRGTVAPPVGAAVQRERLLVILPDADTLVVEEAEIEQRAEVAGLRGGKEQSERATLLTCVPGVGGKPKEVGRGLRLLASRAPSRADGRHPREAASTRS